MKDNFSKQAATYAKFRPTYPRALYDFIFQHTSRFESAWDCGTGNGQVAQALATRFTRVYASDISTGQLARAPVLPNVQYALAPAENSGAPDADFDLVVVGQAVHWFDFERFYAEIDRVLHPNGLFVLFGYGLLRFNDVVLDAQIEYFYRDIVGPYWDAERQYIDDAYESLPFPYEKIVCPNFDMHFEWEFEQLIGFLQSWSAVQHYEKRHLSNPLEPLIDDFKVKWGSEKTKTVHFPIFILMAKPKI